MQNIIDYAGTELSSFSQKPFSDVDSLVLAQLAYEKFERLPGELFSPEKPTSIAGLYRAELFPSLFTGVRDEESNRGLVFALAASPRFRDVRIQRIASSFEPEQEKQFFAMTCLLPDGSAYVAYRGTDSTLVGWKEDVNMAFISPVPSQKESVDYLKATAEQVAGPLRAGGHSKGGNLAVFAAAHCPETVQKRLLAAYSHDGPGFVQGVLESAGYLRVSDRVRKTLPQSSVIGMLLEHQEEYRIVTSNRFGLMQHDPFSWEIEDGDFSYAAHITGGASCMNETLHQWLCTLPNEKRELFVDALFSVLEATGATTTRELSTAWMHEPAAVLAAIKDMDGETAHFVLEAFKALGALYMKNIKLPRLPALQRNGQQI